ncbi:MAG: thioesterase domain-containing protein [Candidatus Brocadiaceae bacterium]|nr:thioesterase domain-containing protein [Candidatus Brocadiaceae bacterium]
MDASPNTTQLLDISPLESISYEIDKRMEEKKTLLRKILYDNIPLAKEMGLQISSYDEKSLSLCAPINRNTNHKGIAFGGSLYSLAVLAGLGLLFLKLKGENLTGNIVICKGFISYHFPVKDDLQATCHMPDATELDIFIRRYRRRGKSRVRLCSHIYSQSKVAVSFAGIYAVHSQKTQTYHSKSTSNPGWMNTYPEQKDIHD